MFGTLQLTDTSQNYVDRKCDILTITTVAMFLLVTLAVSVNSLVDGVLLVL